jgi:hypothetical protein
MCGQVCAHVNVRGPHAYPTHPQVFLKASRHASSSSDSAARRRQGLQDHLTAALRRPWLRYRLYIGMSWHPGSLGDHIRRVSGQKAGVHEHVGVVSMRRVSLHGAHLGVKMHRVSGLQARVRGHVGVHMGRVPRDRVPRGPPWAPHFVRRVRRVPGLEARAILRACRKRWGARGLLVLGAPALTGPRRNRSGASGLLVLRSRSIIWARCEGWGASGLLLLGPTALAGPRRKRRCPSGLLVLGAGGTRWACAPHHVRRELRVRGKPWRAGAVRETLHG